MNTLKVIFILTGAVLFTFPGHCATVIKPQQLLPKYVPSRSEPKSESTGSYNQSYQTQANQQFDRLNGQIKSLTRAINRLESNRSSTQNGAPFQNTQKQIATLNAQVTSLSNQIPALQRSINGLSVKVSNTQSEPVRNKISQQSQFQNLTHRRLSNVESAVKTASNTGFNQSQSKMLTDLQAHNDELQAKLREQNGRIEELTHSLKQLHAQMERLNADTDFRISSNKSRKMGTRQHDLSKSLNTTATVSAITPQKTSNLPSGKEQDLYADALSSFMKQDYNAAISGLQSFINSYPNHSLIVNAHFWLGETYAALHETDHAAAEYSKAYEVYRATKKDASNRQITLKAPEILLKLASTLSKQGNKKHAKVILAELEKEFPVLSLELRVQAQKLQSTLASTP